MVDPDDYFLPLAEPKQTGKPKKSVNNKTARKYKRLPVIQHGSCTVIPFPQRPQDKLGK